LHLKIAWLNIHILRWRPTRADLLKYASKIGLKFRPSIGPSREPTRVKRGGIIGKEAAKAFPIEVVEGPDEALQHCIGHIPGSLVEHWF
jgi:hypothetical protein